jgi:hypothetical protein
MTGIRLAGAIDRARRGLLRDIAELEAVLGHLGSCPEPGLQWRKTVLAKALHDRRMVLTAMRARSLES